MKTREEFKSFAEQKILEGEKQHYLKCKKRTNILLATILPAIALIAGLVCLSLQEGVGKIISLVVGVFGLIFALILIVALSGFKWSKFKSKYTPALIDFLLEDYTHTYDVNGCVAENIYKRSCFSTNYDDYSGEDFLSLQIKNNDNTDSDTTFLISDLHLTRTETATVTRTGANGMTYTQEVERTVTVFNGAFGYVNFPFNFKCRLAINVTDSLCKKIKLEDIKFNKRFRVYTDNQVEALCILTPTMMNNLKYLDSRMSGVSVLLKNNEMFLKLDRNLFELNKHTKKLSADVFNNVYDDIQCIIQIVEEIKNNDKVFQMDTKEAKSIVNNIKDNHNSKSFSKSTNSDKSE